MPNAFANLTEVARTVHKFKIDGHSATKYQQGYILARALTVGGYDWQIDYCPNASYCGRSYIEIRVMFLSKASEATAALSYQLIDQRKKLEPSRETTILDTFEYKSSNAILLMTRRALRESGYLKHDSFTVQCTITVLRNVSANVGSDVSVLSSDLHWQFGELLHSKKGADVTFLVSGETFAAHKHILAARSPVFMAEFFGHMKEKISQCVEIKDMEASVFGALLHFVYTDTLLELDDDEEEVIVMLHHLLRAADRYGLERLKLICEDKLCADIGVETVAATLALAEQHNCLQLKSRCVEFIVNSPQIFDAVIATEGYKHLVESCPSVLSDLLKVAVGRQIK